MAGQGDSTHVTESTPSASPDRRPRHGRLLRFVWLSQIPLPRRRFRGRLDSDRVDRYRDLLADRVARVGDAEVPAGDGGRGGGGRPPPPGGGPRGRLAPPPPPPTP